MSAQNIINSVSSYFSKRFGNQAQELEVNQDKTKAFEQPGKKSNIAWAEITASCAYKDNVILGFGNGAILIFKVDEGRSFTDNIQTLDLEFSGSEDLPIEKLRILTIDVA